MLIFQDPLLVELITIILFSFYAIAILFLLCYGLMQIHLVYHYLKSRRESAPAKHSAIDPGYDYPLVTVQLPVYNEMIIVERLIDAAAAFCYPREKLEIQVLDDSTDET